MNWIYDDEDAAHEARMMRPTLGWNPVLCLRCHSRGPEQGRICNSCRWEWTVPGDSGKADIARYRNDWNENSYDREWFLTLRDSLYDVDEDYDGPVVYFVRAVDDTGPVKIGYSSSPSNRLKALQAASPVKLGFARLVQGDRDLEKDLHRYLASYRQHGEWFEVAGEVVELLP